MKKILFTLLLPLLLIPGFSQNVPMQALGETMSNIFNLSVDDISGTCFMIVKGKQQYFITAAHLFGTTHKSGDAVPVQLFYENQLQTFSAKVYFHTNRKVDIAVFRLPQSIAQKIELPDEMLQYKDTLQKVFSNQGISTDSLFANIDMDVLFFGFPLGNLSTDEFGIKFPLAKRAIISGWVNHNAVKILLLDGHNNPGFSGGPVVTYDTVRKKMCLIGVISGYIPEMVDVQHKKDTFSINQNSGIIVCYGRQYVEDIFTENKDLR